MNATPPTSPQAIEEALKQAYVFSKVDQAQLSLVAGIAEWISMPPQSAVVREGDVCHSLYVLANGRLVVKEAVTKDSELIIARIAQGDVVGELGFLTHQTASATVRADTQSDLVRLGYDQLRLLFKQNPDLDLKFHKELVNTLAERVRKSNQAFRNAVLSGAMGRV
jgi:CRP/FNR family cyclic AMP-dependent transcriptional regulator